MFPTLTASLEYIKAGSLRALAVTTATRSEVLPDVATVGEFVPGYESSTTDGIGAPKGTPPGIIQVLNREINAGLNDPKIRVQLAGFGSKVLAGTSADFARLIASETEKWTSVIGVGNIKLD